MKKEIFIVLSLSFVFLSFISWAQSVNEVIERYNHSIDPSGKLNSIVQIQLDINQKSFSLNNSLISNDTATLTYSIYGDSYSVNWSSGRRMDLNPFSKSDRETKNIIKNHFNILICNDRESLELMEANDSIFVIKRYSDDREIYYEIDRINYNLKATRHKGQETKVTYSEYKMIEGLKVPTVVRINSVIATAVAQKSNYRFTKAKKK